MASPLVHCYLLHAEWLTLMFTEHPEWKVDADLWQRVVTAAIQAGTNAQSHLLSMQEHNSNARTSRRSRADMPNPTEHEAQRQPSMNDGLS